MQYVIFCTDNAGGKNVELRRSVRAAHLKHLATLRATNSLMLAGQLLQDSGDNAIPGGAVGSVLVVEFETLEQVKAWVAADPYTTAGVFRKIEIFPFKSVAPHEYNQ